MKKVIILFVTVLALANCQRVFDNPWDPKNLVYQVIYQAPNAESGSVPVDPKKYSRGMQVEVLGNPGGLYRDGKTLNYWQVDSQQFFPGDSFSLQENTTLTGIWKDSGRAQFSLSTSLASNSSYFYGVEQAPDGSIYAVGYIYGNGNFQFGTQTVSGPTTNNNNALIVKLNSSGNVEWAKSIVSGSGATRFNEVAIDASGYVYVVGTQYGNSLFTYYSGKTAQGSSLTSNAVIAKYTPSGNVLWVKTVAGGTDATVFESVAVNNSGLVVAVGNQSGSGIINWSSSVTTQGGGSVLGSGLIVAFNTTTGDAVWANILSGNNESQIWDVAFSKSGQHIAITGYSDGPTSYQGHSFGFSNKNLFVLYLNSIGQWIWGRYPDDTSTAENEGRSVQFFGNNEIYITGSYYKVSSSQLKFGGLTVSNGNTNNYHFFLAKLNNASDVLNLRTWESGTGLAGSEGYEVATDSWGNVFVAGYVKNGTYGFGSKSLTTHNTSSNFFILKLNPLLQPEWIKSHFNSSSPDSTSFSGISLNKNYVIGVGYIKNNSSYDLGNSVSIMGNHTGFNAALIAYER